MRQCDSCSGRHDPQLRRDPYDRDDRCRCVDGVLQYRTQTGQLIISRYKNDPFKGRIQQTATTQDEKDWNSYVQSQREKYNDPHWDPIHVTEG